MENSIESKGKFFAHYITQTVLRLPERKGETFKVLAYDCETPILDSYLELKPLSAITDEEKQVCANILQVYPDDLIDWIDGSITHPDFQSPYTFQHAIDYLRSKGFALPYMDLSVNDLISYNWIKLAE